MKELIFPLSMIVLCFIALGVMLLFMKRSKNTDKRKEDTKALTLKLAAQDFVNVRDIVDTVLYNKDDYLISYIKVQPISLDLLSKNEKKTLTKKLTEEFSDLEYSFKFIAVSRPVDIAPLVNEYAELLTSTPDPIQKELLRNEIRITSEFSLSGEVVQREFYYMIWEKNSEYAKEDLRKRANDFLVKLENAGLKSEILKKPDIIRFCNLINNPAFAAIEDTNIEPVIPIID